MPALVSVIVVNWNGLRYLKPCLESVLASRYGAIEIIVVDNGSSDGSAEYVQSLMREGKPARLIRNASNLGFAGPCNQGARDARGDFLFVLNNDTVVEPDCIERVVAFMGNRPDIGVVQPRLMKDARLMDEQGGFLMWNGYLFHLGFCGEYKPIFSSSYPVFSVKGAAFFVRRSLYETIGLFREEFFAFYEETDFCHRCWRAGYQVYYHGEAVVFHVGHATAGEMKRRDPVSLWTRVYLNRFVSLFTLLGPRNLFLIFIPHVAFTVASAMFFLATGRVALASAVMRACWRFFCRSRGLLAERQRLQRSFTGISETEVFRKFGLMVKPPRGYLFHFMKGDLGSFWRLPRVKEWTHALVIDQNSLRKIGD